MIDSQTLLSSLRIPYAGLVQPEMNDKAGAVLAAHRAKKTDAARGGGYSSPALPLPQLDDVDPVTGVSTGKPLDMMKLVDDPRSGDNLVVSFYENAAMEAYNQARGSHQPLAAIHAAADRVNELAPITKEPLMRCDHDLVLLSSMPGVLGITAQQVRNGEILSGNIDGGDQVIDVDAIIAEAEKGEAHADLQPTKF